MKIFYMNGIGTSGKDQFLDFVEGFADITRTSTVDKVKEIAIEKFGWDGVKDEKGRKLLASIRYAWGEYNDGPVKEVGKLIRKCKSDALFVMVREFSEMMKMKRLYGGETIVMIRPGIEVGPTEQQFLDEVPTDYSYDYAIRNCFDLKYLEGIAETFVKRRIL